MVVVMGIDLAGSPKRRTGYAILRESYVLETGIVYTDKEIIDLVKKYMPRVVAIDSPLSMPIKGYRKVDIMMKRRGYRVLPPTWPSMKMLVYRAMKLVKEIRSIDREAIVIETHPLSAFKSSNCSSLYELLTKASITDNIDADTLSNDERDGLIAALVAYYYSLGKHVSIKAVNGEIYLLPPICRT